MLHHLVLTCEELIDLFQALSIILTPHSFSRLLTIFSIIYFSRHTITNIHLKIIIEQIEFSYFFTGNSPIDSLMSSYCKPVSLVDGLFLPKNYKQEVYK